MTLLTIERVSFFQDLVKIGLANQTTMYKRETRAIGQLFEKTLMAKYGPAEIGAHWMAFDTICDATQERQVVPRFCPYVGMLI